MNSANCPICEEYVDLMGDFSMASKQCYHTSCFGILLEARKSVALLLDFHKHRTSRQAAMEFRATRQAYDEALKEL